MKPIPPVGLAAALLVTVAAQAQSPTPAPQSSVIEVQAPRVLRHDVQTVCPTVHADLPEALASAFAQHGREARMQVRFTVDRDGVSQVQASNGPQVYRRRVASALREIECRTDRSVPQQFEMNVQFIDPASLQAVDAQGRQALQAVDTLSARAVR